TRPTGRSPRSTGPAGEAGRPPAGLIRSWGRGPWAGLSRRTRLTGRSRPTSRRAPSRRTARSRTAPWSRASARPARPSGARRWRWPRDVPPPRPPGAAARVGSTAAVRRRTRRRARPPAGGGAPPWDGRSPHPSVTRPPSRGGGRLRLGLGRRLLVETVLVDVLDHAVGHEVPDRHPRTDPVPAVRRGDRHG